MSNFRPDDKEDLEKLKLNKDIDKIEIEIRQLRKGTLRFWLGNFIVPLFVATVSILIVWSTGLFNAQQVKIENLRFQFTKDTTEYSAKRRLLEDSLAIDNEYLKTTRENLGAAQKRSRYLDSLNKLSLANLNPAIRKLINQNTLLTDTLKILSTKGTTLDFVYTYLDKYNQVEDGFADLLHRTLHKRPELGLPSGFNLYLVYNFLFQKKIINEELFSLVDNIWDFHDAIIKWHLAVIKVDEYKNQIDVLDHILRLLKAQ
ncbi:MAG TPA: hypothetical protein VNS58_03145 [Puia sp.]|nr:hypothetical protein [Puia sp.]